MLSVDVWDPAWPLETRRRAVASAPALHRLKGTLSAVELALATLSISADITEWWQAEPPARRGTFKVTAWVRGILPGDDVILSERVQRQAQAMVGAAKPKSRVFEFQLGANFHGAAAPLGALQSVAAVRPTMSAIVAMPAGRVAAVASAQAVVAIRRKVMLDDITKPRARAALTGAVRNIQFMHVAMEAAA